MKRKVKGSSARLILWQTTDCPKKKGDYMSVYKDEQRGTWYCMFRYNDWTGRQKQKCKRGFKTKREAKEYEEQFMQTTEADMNMKVGAFVEIYFRDKQGELKERSIKNKR